MITVFIIVIVAVGLVALALALYIGVQESRHIRVKAGLRSSARAEIATEWLAKTEALTLADKRGKALDEMKRSARVLEASNIDLANVIQSKDEEIVGQSSRLFAMSEELSQSKRACHAATTSNGLMSLRLSTIHRESAPIM